VSIKHTIQAFSSCPICQSVNIPDDIWNAMEPAIKNRVKAIWDQVKAKRHGDKPIPSGTIQAQYPTMKQVNMVDTNIRGGYPCSHHCTM
jgi:hypothetical protein